MNKMFKSSIDMGENVQIQHKYEKKNVQVQHKNEEKKCLNQA